ncbi:NAD(P)-binding protein [Methanoplanus sp. FWC-SCC4]|uniref:NAD(P)-binding protein n=1 Tax=Methanochimaera problematica TaxID=2609417 RepID=A0AA97I2S3_9EURY|nr:FAD-dependent oxidoreductase [Methanoplanus sp. FWC-SCC4]WOF16590.1 NAD(P)-binding protein [Methanoplanus sp. FWC-SCC4]
MKTAILGGGLTGLTLARLLSLTGEEVVVLEKEEKYGGLCRSKTEDGFTFDIGGSHIIFSRDTEVNDFMREVLRENKDTRNRNTKIFFKGNYVKYPFENGLYQLPAEDRFFCINEFIKTLIAHEKGELKDPENFREWIYLTFGKGIAESYMVPYNEKIWNFPTEKMSHHWVDGRIPRPPVEDIIKSAIGIETEGYTHQSVFTYPVNGGIEALTQAIAEPVLSKIRTGFCVESVRENKDGEGFVISDGKEDIICSRVINTLPLQVLLPCLENIPDDIKTACNDLKYNSIACVGIGVEGELSDISWLYVPQTELGKFNRISFPSNYSTEVAPKGCSSVLAEITYNEGDDVSKMTDEELIDHVTEGLIKMDIITDKNLVRYSTVERFEFAYVVYDTEYQKNIKTVREYVEALNIDLVGRFSEFEYINMDGCIRHVLNYIENRYKNQE